jgi:hypothetical protein
MKEIDNVIIENKEISKKLQKYPYKKINYFKQILSNDCDTCFSNSKEHNILFKTISEYYITYISNMIIKKTIPLTQKRNYTKEKYLTLQEQDIIWKKICANLNLEFNGIF